jgi:hypothetical protein
MAETSYHIVFDGTLTGEVGLADTKKQLAAMFKMNATQVEALFTGKPVVVKRNVDEATAAKFKAAFKKAGAACKVVPANADKKPASAASGPVASSASAASGSAPAAGSDAGGRMAGKDILNKQVPQDLGDLSMGEPGEDIPTRADDADAPIPDVSGLSLSNDEGYLVPEKDTPEPDVDISGLSFNKSD